MKLRWIALAIACITLTSAAHAQQREPMQQRLGYPAQARLLIIHADDFGMMHSVNRAISQALENGWVTSASVMVPTPWYPEAVGWAHRHPSADLGIHLVLNSEWVGMRWAPISPVDKVASLLDPDGYFYNDPSRFARVKMSEAQTELRAQIDKARAQGLHISHLDSHMIALVETRHLYAIYENLGHEYDLPIRRIRSGNEMPDGVVPPANALAVDDLISMPPGVAKRDWFAWYKKNLSRLKPGIYELIVHLAYNDDEMRGAARNHPDWGAAWRQQDFDMVRSPQFRNFLRDQKFILVSWQQLSRAYATHVQPNY
ncbi:MAG TPA: polysaccharide deacetylase family protein [Candidatus Acidoferrales bacterium]|nr:polysaccharide deacetylase family protein [Candidatus Acidoferrales bacterium]